jgi:hypothetical protein
MRPVGATKEALAKMADLVPRVLFDYFSAKPMGTLSAVSDLLGGENGVLRAAFAEFSHQLDKSLVEATLQERTFRAYNEAAGREGERRAREWLAIHIIDEKISRSRLLELASRESRPPPYDLSELGDVKVNKDRLVSVDAFKFDGSALERNGRAFMMAPSTESENAAYWFLLQVRSNSLSNVMSIRLDPFMHGPAESYPRMFYAMRVYGKPLDWARIDRLNEPEHGEWMPTYVSGHQRTDFVWEPDGSEVHFICEELPADERCETRAARYLHAIYDTKSQRIVHLDGALRIYSRNELEERKSTHVRHSGKAGIRTKLFRTDAPITRECLADLVSTFFVWNDDVANYFAAR